jgi:hypothetical protein
MQALFFILHLVINIALSDKHLNTKNLITLDYFFFGT